MERLVEPDLREGLEKQGKVSLLYLFFSLVQADSPSLNRTILLSSCPLNAFTTGKPFQETNSLEFNIGRYFGGF